MARKDPGQQEDERALRAALQDAQRGPRLHKVLARCGVASRREAERLVEEGRVAVNGVVVDFLPAWVDPEEDRVEVDGRRVNPAKRSRKPSTYLLLNKPRHALCTNTDPEGRRTVFDLVPHEQRLFCVGRLDADSTGLVLLTDDGELANRLMHPRYEVPKTYRVTVRGTLGDEDIEKLREGIILAEKETGKAAKAKAERVKLLRRDREATRLIMTLKEGRNREIRRMLARRGYKVKRLERIALGPVRLKGVGAGQWRPLSASERKALRQAAFGGKSEGDHPSKGKQGGRNRSGR